MLKKLEEIAEHYKKLEEKLSDPAVTSNVDEYVKIMKQISEMKEIVEKYSIYKKVTEQIQDNLKLLKEETDEELIELAKEETEELKSKKEELEKELKILLLPKDPLDDKNIILEIRAGTGGEEAALFAADLFRMYQRFAESKGWKVEIISSNVTGNGGFKEVICNISGKSVYSLLKYERGVHRVQRIPITESGGRIHTSAVTVAVLPEAEERDIDINPKDLRIDYFRSSGAGGQHVNTTDSAVRITHIPTGIVVSCQNERSQHKNKAQAMKILRARLYQKMKEDEEKKRAQDRRVQVGTGDRSEKIRTYNFPQNRVTDHRIGLTLYKLGEILDGSLDEIINALITHYQAEALKSNS